MLLNLADDVQLLTLFQQDIHGQTPFHLAGKNRMPTILKLLTEVNSIDMDKTDNCERTPFHYVAMSCKYVKKVEFGLKKSPIGLIPYGCVNTLLYIIFISSNAMKIYF